MTRPLPAALRGALALFAWFASAAAASAQGSLEDIPEAFRDKAIAVKVHTTVLGADSTTWEDETLKYTIPGTPVAIRLVSEDLIVFVQLTPYQGVPSRLVLISQGQVWIREGESNVRYHTTLNTFPVAFGERIFFYPLGIEGKGPAPITVVITVEPYRAPEPAPDAAEKPKPAPGAAPKPTP